MKAVVLTTYGGPEVLHIRSVPDPLPGPDEIAVDVAYTALNRADLLQRMGMYPPPGPASAEIPEIPGLEFSGTVSHTGPRVTRWRPGDRVFGLLNGGGYAEKVVLHEAMALPVPEHLTLAEAGGIAEVFLTAYDAIVHRARLALGERVLIHAGGSGVGTAAIQLARALGATVYATVGTPEKAAGVRQLGAHPIEYRTEDFEAIVLEKTGGHGVHAVLDFIGSPYLARNMNVVAILGRIVIIGLLGGAQADIDLGLLQRNRMTITGTALRSRTFAEKLALTAEFERHVLPLFTPAQPGSADTAPVRPIIDRQFGFADVAAAHEYMATNENFGKILLHVAT